MSGVWGSVWPVITFVGGAGASFTRDLVTEKRQIARVRDARDAERQRAIVDRRESFELDHLQKVHSALSDLSRAAARAHHADSMAADQGVPYGRTQLPNDLAETLRQASAAVYSLKGLVLDDHLRSLVDQAHVALNAPSGLRDVDVQEREGTFGAGVLAVERAQSALAERIREIYVSAERGA